jgi:type IV pilus assembly protein PilN
MPRINLLPWREQQRTERKKSFAVGMFGALIAAGAVTLGGYFFMNSLIGAQNARNDRLVGEIKVLDGKIQEIERLEQEKEQFIGRMQVIEKLQRSRPEIVHIFDTLVQTVPDGIYLTSVVQDGQKFRIQGATQSPSRISTFMRQLEGSGWFKEAFPKFNDSNFTLDAVQVTKVNDDPAPAARKKAGAK